MNLGTGTTPRPPPAQPTLHFKDVIVGPGSGTLAARKATNTIPIVMTFGDPVGSGLVASLARPGGNVTGLSGVTPELGAKQLELLKETFPKVSRVAVLWWAQSATPRTNPNAVLEKMKDVANTLRLTLQSVELRSVDDLERALTSIREERAGALVALRNPVVASQRTRIVNFAAQARLPAIYPDNEFVDAGGLMSYGVNIADLWNRAAVYVDKILKGTRPAELPIEQPTKFELLVNLKTAKALGITIPQSILLRADRVIE